MRANCSVWQVAHTYALYLPKRAVSVHPFTVYSVKNLYMSLSETGFPGVTWGPDGMAELVERLSPVLGDW